MRRAFISALTALFSISAASAQIGRTFDWYTAAGDNQRSGWEKSDTKFTKEEVKDFSQILKMPLGGAKDSPRAQESRYFLPPVVFGTLIGHRGFKELAFLTNGLGDVFAIDVDLDTLYWTRHLDLPQIKKPAESCPLGITSQPTMEPGVTFGARRKKGAASTSSEDHWKKIFAPRVLFVLASDGKLYRLDTSTGQDMAPPVAVMPPGARASNLSAGDNVVYATTRGGCGAPNALWQVSLSGADPKVASFPSPNPEGFTGVNGALIGFDDNIYAQTTNTLQILSPANLQVEQTFSGALGNTSPVAFTYQEHDLIVTAGNKGGLYVFDTKSLSQFALESDPLIVGENSHIVGLATWESTEGVRWIVAAVSGPSVDAPNSSDGAIVALQLTGDIGSLAIKRVWTSSNLTLPQTPVIANGVVFALSAGEMNPKKKKLEGHAVLYAFDGNNGNVLYSTGDEVPVPANQSGITIANGRIFFTTIDGTFYGFGYHLEH